MLLDNNNKVAKIWLQCGVLALGLAGIYSIFLVMLRAPGLSTLVNPSLFKSSLVVHVNLSVLVWLLSFAALTWSMQASDDFISKLCGRIAMLSTVLMATSPMMGASISITNNYVPMLENIAFIISLSLFAATIFVCAINSLVKYIISGSYSKFLNIATLSSCIIFLTSCLCFTLSYLELKVVIQNVFLEIDHFYELLFWSGGHILQFVYTQVLMLVWVALWEQYAAKDLPNRSMQAAIFLLNMTLALLGVAGHVWYDIISGEFVEYYTMHMKYAAGVAPSLLLAMLFYYSFAKQQRPLNKHFGVSFAALLCSICLFLFGNIIGELISGINVTIPAHYHGVIVGISIALMGAAYMLCDIDSALARSQIYLLSFGQLVHISGLAIAGGYGVLRKTPGVEMALQAKLGMVLMGAGGIIAITGGLIFVCICGQTASRIRLH